MPEIPTEHFPSRKAPCKEVCTRLTKQRGSSGSGGVWPQQSFNNESGKRPNGLCQCPAAWPGAIAKWAPWRHIEQFVAESKKILMV